VTIFGVILPFPILNAGQSGLAVVAQIPPQGFQMRSGQERYSNKISDRARLPIHLCAQVKNPILIKFAKANQASWPE
jgi:hypothetical protein